jgi:hypothetical protein
VDEKYFGAKGLDGSLSLRQSDEIWGSSGVYLQLERETYNLKEEWLKIKLKLLSLIITNNKDNGYPVPNK